MEQQEKRSNNGTAYIYLKNRLGPISVSHVHEIRNLERGGGAKVLVDIHGRPLAYIPADYDFIEIQYASDPTPPPEQAPVILPKREPQRSLQELRRKGEPVPNLHVMTPVPEAVLPDVDHLNAVMDGLKKMPDDTPENVRAKNVLPPDETVDIPIMGAMVLDSVPGGRSGDGPSFSPRPFGGAMGSDAGRGPERSQAVSEDSSAKV